MDKNSFAVNLTGKNNSTTEFYYNQLLKKVRSYRSQGLTVAGDDFPPLKKGRGVELAGRGNLMTVGTAKNHDVEWIERPEYACEKGIDPVYDLVKDWNKISTALDNYVDEKYGLRVSINGNSRRVTVSGDMVFVHPSNPCEETLVLRKTELKNLAWNV